MTQSPTPRRRARTQTYTRTDWHHPATRRGYLLPSEAAALLRVSDRTFAALRDRDWDGADDATFTLRPDR